MTTRPSVLITGCSHGGIGYHLAKAYCDQGYLVFATARNIYSMEGLSGLGIETLQLDVKDIDSIRDARNYVHRVTGGRLDILVNNAGQSASVPAIEVDIELARSVFDTNFFGMMRMCQEFIDLLIEAKGQIINIGSIVGIMPLPFSAVYNASKAAVQQYSDTLRIEMEPFGVNVTTVITGTIKTNIWTKDPDLRPDSRYYLINDEYIANRQNAAGARGGTDPDVYARWLVEQTSRKQAPGWLYKGLYATRAWLMPLLLPRSYILSMMSRIYGLDKLAPRLLDEARKKAD